MKTAIVYYSLTGNVECAAEKLARALGAALIRLRPVNDYPASGVQKFFHAGRSALKADAPDLLPCPFPAGEYDRVIFGSPVWAGTFAPPLRSFIRQNGDALRGCRFAAFLCCGGGNAEKAFSRLLAELNAGAFDAQMTLVDPKSRPGGENERRIGEFCLKLLND